MSVNVKQNGELVKIANNISMVQANWNETDDSKVTCIRNKPETLKTINEINENTDENALAGASVIKELIETGAAGGGCNIVYLTKAEYEALPDSKLTDDVEYRITDANTASKIDATDVTYGDSTVEEAINEVQESVSTLNESLVKVKTYVGSDGKLHFVDASGADSVLPFSGRTPYIDVRGLTSNTSNEYFDFSVSASRYNTSPDVFYKAVNGDGKSSHSEYGWYATSPLTITVKLKKHVPTAFLLNVTGITHTPWALGVANLVSYTNIEMDVNNGSARRYLFRPTCGIGESFSLTFNSGYEWSSFTDFHLIAY